MKFYVLHYKGYAKPNLGVFATVEEAMVKLWSEVEDEEDKKNYYIQEYEGWSTCMRWRYGDEIDK